MSEQPTSVSSTSTTKSTDERRYLLDTAVLRRIANKWRVESRSDFQATIAKGRRTDHVLHPILTLVTLGFFGRERRHLLMVDQDGNITETAR